ncbi:MAG: pilus assembly protein PilM [Oscillospiraceae bacterium]|jgi:cell division protein FtsA|nr:pilus assembly protein PilM [Oscillospiraceae bacterium]
MQKNAKKQAVNKLEEQGDRIFALDIGTRTVVGVVGEQAEDEFVLVEYAVEPHSKRAMSDGQIEDVKQVAKIVAKVKTRLEELTGIKLTKVSIAAAGRALKTGLTKMEFDISERESITADMVKSMEIEAVQKAQSELNLESSDKVSFYCVGYSVINYLLDDYKMLSLETHKGKNATIELIATFLPSVVVDGLYSVMSLNGLSVAGMTLEPIAAMNVVVPPEIRAINIALVDIGAGTSDIAVSRDGSVVAYSMATTAGDEITEEIIKAFFVDFAVAEEMKLNSTSGKKEFEYRDIFGLTQKVSTTEFNRKIDGATENLAGAVCEHIQSANKASPAAVFLVGGGSLISGLSKKVAAKLGLDENRVAIGNHRTLRGVDTRGKELGAEFITPIGIALTAILNRGYDFSTITLNDEKIRIFDTKKISVFELLTLAGYKTTDIMGRSGRGLNYTVNGKRKLVKGGNLTPAEITVSGQPASINTNVTQGDEVKFTPAVSGENASITLKEVVSQFDTIDDVSVYVNGEEKPGTYELNPFDKIEIISADADDSFYPVPQDSAGAAPVKLSAGEIAFEPDPNGIYTDTKPEEYGEITLSLNGTVLTLDPTPDRAPHKFLELLNFTEFDMVNPVASYTLLLNGRDASFNDPIKDGDTAVIEIVEKKAV